MGDTEAVDVEVLKQEIEGLKATVLSQARAIGQMQRTISNSPAHLTLIKQASDKAKYWERIAMKRLDALRRVVSRLDEMAKDIASTKADVQGGMTDG